MAVSKREIEGNLINQGFNTELHDELVARAKALRPLLERNAAIHEEKGELTEEVVAALDQAELFKMAGPRRWGGLQVPCRTMADALGELGKGCPSTAWVSSILNSSFWLVSTLAPALQRRIYANGIPRVCGATNGAGTVIKKDGKLLVSGSWSYGSASHHSEWVLVPAQNEEGVVSMIALPMKEVRIVNTWVVAGMKGTGSDTVIAEDVAITPDQMCVTTSFGTGTTVQPVESFPKEPSDFFIGTVFLRAKMLGVMVGIAEGLLETIMATKAKPLIYTNFAHKVDSDVFQAGIGECAAKIRAARTIMHNACDLCDMAAARGHTLTYPERAETKGEVAVAAELLIEAVDKLINLGGSSSFALANKAQRYWRDFNVGIRHAVFHIGLGFHVYGRQLLGVDPNVVPSDLV